MLLSLFIKSNNRKPQPDKELIDRYRNSNDPVYVGELFQRYTHLVFGVCMKYLNHEEDSRDALMEVFEKVLIELKRHEVDHFKAWLYFVAKNHCLMKLRKDKSNLSQYQGYEKFVTEIMEFGSMEHLKGENGTINLEADLQRGMDNLKDEQRYCIKLFYFEAFSYDEIAKQTGYNINQVKSFLQNGKRNLKIHLKSRHGYQ